MNEYNNLEDVAQVIGDGGPFNSDTEFETVGELVSALINLGNTDEVYARHDDHLGLEDELSSKFLSLPLGDVHDDDNEEKFGEQIDAVLEQVNIIIPLANRELSEDDIEEIVEDKYHRGISDDI